MFLELASWLRPKLLLLSATASAVRPALQLALEAAAPASSIFGGELQPSPVRLLRRPRSWRASIDRCWRLLIRPYRLPSVRLHRLLEIGRHLLGLVPCRAVPATNDMVRARATPVSIICLPLETVIARDLGARRSQRRIAVPLLVGCPACGFFVLRRSPIGNFFTAASCTRVDLLSEPKMISSRHQHRE
ncbi:unnamed protein product, partial [Trichogramma brassicae]